MTNAEAKELCKGARVSWSIGNGWRQAGTFRGLVQTRLLGTFTADQVARGEFDPKGGRTIWKAEIQTTDERGRDTVVYISPRRLTKEASK